MKLLKFYTDSCSQCKMLTKALENFNLVPIESINCEEDDDNLVEKFHIRNIPTLILVDDNGEFLRKFSGYITEEQLTQIITTELKSNNKDI